MYLIASSDEKKLIWLTTRLTHIRSYGDLKCIRPKPNKKGTRRVWSSWALINKKIYTFLGFSTT